MAFWVGDSLSCRRTFLGQVATRFRRRAITLFGVVCLCATRSRVLSQARLRRGSLVRGLTRRRRFKYLLVFICCNSHRLGLGAALGDAVLCENGRFQASLHLTHVVAPVHVAVEPHDQVAVSLAILQRLVQSRQRFAEESLLDA